MPVQFVWRSDSTPGVPPQDVIVALFGGSTAVAGTPVDGTVFIADRDYEVVKITEVHSVGTASLTFDFRKCTGTTAPASGTSILTSTFDGNSTANTVVTKTPGSGITATQATRRLTTGDRLALDETTAPTGYIGLIQIHLRPIQSSNDQIGF